MKVLLVDDEEPAAAATRERLERVPGWEISVQRVATLAEALEADAGDSFDAVLLDLSLPDAAPDAVVVRFREAAPELPIVVLTSIERRQAGVEAIRQGAEDLLIKDSVSTESLCRAIRYAIERRAATRLLERSNRALESFAHTVAHEIRSPLSTVSFACELVRHQELDEAGSRQLDRIRHAVSEIDGIIDGLLEYASATHPSRVEDVDLSGLVEEIVAGVEDEAADGSSVQIGELPVVRGVRPQLRLLLHNLLRNAVAYADPEDPVIRVDAVRRGRAWEVLVEDNGSGIPPEECERVFDMFERGSAPKGNGSGLGLAICRRIVEDRGGAIEVDVGPLGGCRVRFTLPDDTRELDVLPL